MSYRSRDLLPWRAIDNTNLIEGRMPRRFHFGDYSARQTIDETPLERVDLPEGEYRGRIMCGTADGLENCKVTFTTVVCRVAAVEITLSRVQHTIYGTIHGEDPTAYFYPPPTHLLLWALGYLFFVCLLTIMGVQLRARAHDATDGGALEIHFLSDNLRAQYLSLDDGHRGLSTGSARRWEVRYFAS